MAQRKIGKKTRSRLLDTACDVFCEKGFRDAKVADICRRAGTNVAAVNYYFGGKDALYREAWRLAFERDIVPDPELSPEALPEDCLRSRIHGLIQKFVSRTSSGQFTRMYLMELANPTGLIDEGWRRMIEPKRQQLLKIIRMLIGPEAPDNDVFFCELSIINQCRGFLIIQPQDLEYLLRQPLTPGLIQRMADHITKFSLAGIYALRDMK
jgi:AcrR family transcriptional regulator